MDESNIDTARLRLVLQSPGEVRNSIDNMTPEERAQLSEDWWSLMDSADEPDPWIHGYRIQLREDRAVVGSCGFKGPPSEGGMVEIAYGIDPDFQGNGYATEAAMGLITFAFRTDRVHLIRAHTLPEFSASTRILGKCGFLKTAEVNDPEDGLVWRWERLPD